MEKVSSIPEIGKKRPRPVTDSQIDIVKPAPIRKTKVLPDGKEQIIEVEQKKVSQSQRTTSKAVPKPKPKVFKLGTWNPDTVIVEEEIEKFGTSDEPNYETSHRANTRNIIRAINTNNFTLLKKVVNDRDNIFSLQQPWSENDEDFTPLHYVLQLESRPMLATLLPTFAASKSQILNNSYQMQRDDFYTNRKRPKEPLLNRVDTGNVSHKAYGTAIRRVEMTRGNRQGNNAFANFSVNSHQNSSVNPLTRG